MQTVVICSDHAAHRKARRNLSDADIAFVLDHGQHVRSAGALHVFLGRRHIPGDKETQRRFGHLEGTVLVLDDAAQGLVLITAYRNRDGMKRIRAKAKYDRRPDRPHALAA